MPIPPLTPIKKENGEELCYFEHLVNEASEVLKKDGITLDFTGYKETIERYSNLKETDINTAWELTKELNTWSEYFSDIANLIQKLYLDAETEKLEIHAEVSMRFDAKKVAAGDRYANTAQEVVLSRKKRNVLKALYDELVGKVKFLERAYYHCKATCDWAYRTRTEGNGVNG